MYIFQQVAENLPLFVFVQQLAGIFSARRVKLYELDYELLAEGVRQLVKRFDGR